MMKGEIQRTNGKGLHNVSPLSIRRPALRGAADSEGRSVFGIRGDPKEGSDIKDSLGTSLKIRSQGFVEQATRRDGCQTLAALDIFSSSGLNDPSGES